MCPKERKSIKIWTNEWRIWSAKLVLNLLSRRMCMILCEKTKKRLSNPTYNSKQILCVMGIEYKKIHACLNDWILYQSKSERFHKCPLCNWLHYKVKTYESSCDDDNTKASPMKILGYLPIITRFKCLFANAKDTKNIIWHAEKRKCDKQFHHLADSLQWKKVYSLFPDFRAERWNLS